MNGVIRGIFTLGTLALAWLWAAKPVPAFQDAGGLFSASTVPAVATDKSVYVSTSGLGSNSGKGAVWAFSEQTVCAGTSTPCTSAADCNPAAALCSHLKWVYLPQTGALPVADTCRNGSGDPCNWSGQVTSIPVPSPDGQSVYVGSDNTYFYALPADPGATCIRFESSHPDPTRRRLPELDHRVGCVRWTRATDAKIRAGAAVSPDNATVYIGTQFSGTGADKGRLWGFNAVTGLKPAGWINNYVSLSQGELRFTPVISPDGGTIYVGSSVAGLFAVSSGGTVLWRFDDQTQGCQEFHYYPIGGFLQAGVLYAGTETGVVALKVDVPAGAAPYLLWRYAIEGGVHPTGRQAPVQGPTGFVFLSGKDPGTVHKVSTPPSCGPDGRVDLSVCGAECPWMFRLGGTISWSTPAASLLPSPPASCTSPFAPIAQPYAVYTGAHKDDCFYAIGSDGQKLWDFESPVSGTSFFSSPSVSNDDKTVHIGGQDGVFWALDSQCGCVMDPSTKSCSAQTDRDRVTWCFNTKDLPLDPAQATDGCKTLPAHANTCCDPSKTTCVVNPGYTVTCALQSDDQCTVTTQ